MEKNIVQKLVELGFSSKESLVYLALLELGKAPVSDIAKKARINRTTVYDIVISLEREGLISRSIDPKKKTFSAEPPDKIPVVLERKSRQLAEQAKEAKDLVEELSLLAVKSPVKPKVKIYEGADGLKALYDASLLCKTYLRSFLNPDELETFDESYIHEYFKRRAKKGIKIQGILNESEKSRSYKKLEKELKREVRIVPKEKMDIVPEIYIYDDVISIFSHKERLGVMIESKDIAYAFKKLYDLAWEHAGEIKE